MNLGNKYLADVARYLPVLTGPQALCVYFDNNLEKMRRTLRADEAAGLISLSTEPVRLRVSETPITTLNPGEWLPSPHQIAYLAEKRWSELVQPTLIIRGTAKLSALVGGRHGAVVVGHLSHEVALADVFLNSKRRIDPAFQWMLVTASPGAGALPDAIAGDVAIELIGRYSGATVAAKLTIAGNWKLELW